MASNLKRLQDRAAAISASLDALAAVEDRSEAQVAEIRKLTEEGDKVQADLDFEAKLAAKQAEIRAAVKKTAPADAGDASPAVEPVKEKAVEIRHLMPSHTELRAFNRSAEDVESAYRCGRWLRAHVYKNADDLRWCKDHGVEARAMSEGNNALGGALVPDEFAARVIRLVENYGTLPAACENVSMTRDVMTIPKRISGTTAYFVGEGDSITASDPGYTNVQLVAKKLAVGCRMSTEVVEDALVSLADAVAAEFATSLAYKIDLCGWIGDGTQATYGGIHGIADKINNGNYTASVVSAASGNVSFETLDIDDFIAAVGKLPLYARAGAAWYISPAGKAAAIDRLKYAAGGNTVENVSGGPMDSFLGYPVKMVHVMNSTLGSDVSKVKVLFGNLGLSSIYAARRAFSVRLFDQVYATTDQLLLQGTMRFDVNHHSLGTTSEVGPVIALKTAAS